MILAHLANHIRSMLLTDFPLHVAIFDCTSGEVVLVVLVDGNYCTRPSPPELGPNRCGHCLNHLPSLANTYNQGAVYANDDDNANAPFSRFFI